MTGVVSVCDVSVAMIFLERPALSVPNKGKKKPEKKRNRSLVEDRCWGVANTGEVLVVPVQNKGT